VEKCGADIGTGDSQDRSPEETNRDRVGALEGPAEDKHTE
jgi:hypothetical protein